MNLNKAMIIGNLTRDPEIKNTPTGQSVASFSVATNFVWNDASGQKQERVEFHNIVAWRRLAEICGQYLKKGSKIYAEGRLQTRDWTQDGVKKYRTEIILENMIMLGSNPGMGGNPMGQAQAGMSQSQGTISNEPVINVEEPVSPNMNNNSNPAEEEIKVENIPF